MPALDLIIDRSSPPRLEEPGPDGAQVDRILAAGSRAPDHGRLRPFRFVVIAGEARARFGTMMEQSLARRDPGASEATLEAERGKPLRAPLIVVVAAQIQPHPKVPEIEQVLAAAAATQNIVLAAHALGFAANWKTGPAAYDPVVKAEFGFGPDDAIVGFIYIGTPKIVLPPKAVETASLTRHLEA